MFFRRGDLSSIKILREEKHYGAKRFLKEFPNRNWSIAALNRLIAKNFIFQQDIAPAHRAKETVGLLSRETPEFISPALCPRHPIALILIHCMDYKIWSVLQERVYQTRIRDVDHLKQRIVEEWNRVDQGIVDNAINEWRKRLRACIRANGGHFEHQL